MDDYTFAFSVKVDLKWVPVICSFPADSEEQAIKYLAKFMLRGREYQDLEILRNGRYELIDNKE